MREFLIELLVALALVAAIAVAAYYLLRKLFERVANTMADHIERVVGLLAMRAAETRAGRMTTTVARTAVGGYTHLGAYAAAEGITEEAARRQFAQSIERLARVMDSAVKLPVIGPVGLDAALGLFPVAGDFISGGVSVLLIARSLRYGLPPELIAKMLGNVLFDLLLGAVPVVGDVADAAFRANARNVVLLLEYLGDEARNTIDVPETPNRYR